jgi:cold shock CspA family protein
VKWYSDRKGFGFVTPNDGSEDIFCHKSSITGQTFLLQGETVSYDVENDDGKLKAINVTGAGPRKWPEGVLPSVGKEIGTVKWYDDDKGFGFITSLSNLDYFVHHSGIIGADNQEFKALLIEGEQVEFAIEEDDEGKPFAKDVSGPNGETMKGKGGKKSRRGAPNGRRTRQASE